MEENKKLYEISWQVTEPVYRLDPALSQSVLGTYERKGFQCIDSLYEKEESESLTFGSVVDTLVTCPEEFDTRFMVSSTAKPAESICRIVEYLYASTGAETLVQIPKDTVLTAIILHEWQPNWKDDTRVNNLVTKGSDYYTMLSSAGNRQIIGTDVMEQALQCREALFNSPLTSLYFRNDSLQTEYQLKFKSDIEGITYKGMLDMVVTDHANRTVTPVDLKTTSNPEYMFFKSFVKWGYQIQARLYYRLLRKAMDSDDVFKDYTIKPFTFIVINKDRCIPMAWAYTDYDKFGTLQYNDLVMRDPCELGKELHHYLKDRPLVPDEVSLTDTIDIIKFLYNYDSGRVVR